MSWYQIRRRTFAVETSWGAWMEQGEQHKFPAVQRLSLGCRMDGSCPHVLKRKRTFGGLNGAQMVGGLLFLEGTVRLPFGIWNKSAPNLRNLASMYRQRPLKR